MLAFHIFSDESPLKRLSPQACGGKGIGSFVKTWSKNKPMVLVTVKLIRNKSAQSSSKEVRAASSAF